MSTQKTTGTKNEAPRLWLWFSTKLFEVTESLNATLAHAMHLRGRYPILSIRNSCSRLHLQGR